MSTRKKAKHRREVLARSKHNVEVDNFVENMKHVNRAMGAGEVDVDGEKLFRFADGVDKLVGQAAGELLSMLVMYHLIKDHHFGAVRLDRFLEASQRYTLTVSKNERGIADYKNELYYDAKVDVDELTKPWLDRYEKLHKKALMSKWEEMLLFASDTVITIILYTLYSAFGWKQKRLTRLVNTITDEYIAVCNTGNYGKYIKVTTGVKRLILRSEVLNRRDPHLDMDYELDKRFTYADVGIKPKGERVVKVDRFKVFKRIEQDVLKRRRIV